MAEIVEGIQGTKEIWETKPEEGQEDKYAIFKKAYRRLIKLDGGIKEIVMGKEEEEKEKPEGEAGGAGADDDGSMDVQQQEEEDRTQSTATAT